MIEKRLIYYVSDGYKRWYSCDLDGTDNQILLLGNGDNLYMSSTIEGMFVFRTTSASKNYNGYITNLPPPPNSSGYVVSPELLCVDFNGTIYPVKSPSISSTIFNYGKYACLYSTGDYDLLDCVTGSRVFAAQKLLRWSR